MKTKKYDFKSLLENESSTFCYERTYIKMNKEQNSLNL